MVYIGTAMLILEWRYAMLFRRVRVIYLSSVVCFLGIFVACGSDNGTGSPSWNCDVTLRLDSATGDGSGSGGSRDEALTSALQIACSKLNLDSDQRSLCEGNMSFSKTQTIGNAIILVSPAERSIRCSGSS